MKIKKITIFRIVSIIIVVISLSYIVFWCSENINTKKTIKKVYKYAYIDLNTSDIAAKKELPSGKTINLPEKKIDFNKLHTKYSSAKAWIKINNTNVDFPLVQGIDNAFYLNHSINNSFSTAGWPFIDYRNNIDFTDTNTVIYGHNRLDDSMFGSLTNCIKKQWYLNDDNKYIFLNTKEEALVYEIFSIYEIPAETYFSTVNFKHSGEYTKFLTTILNRSMYNFNVPVNASDKLLTVSTCSNNLRNRIVIHAKKI
ncbi:MAG: class B sortase [Clostridia bacterium]